MSSSCCTSSSRSSSRGSAFCAASSRRGPSAESSRATAESTPSSTRREDEGCGCVADLTALSPLSRAQAYYEALARREQTLYHVHWAEQRDDHEEAKRLEARLDGIDREVDALEEKLDQVEPKKWKAHGKAR